jgi:hypothetical protein
MNSAIWKFHIMVERPTVLQMPHGAQILSAGWQGGPSLQIWAAVDPNALIASRLVHVIGTGHENNGRILTDGKFVGTVMMPPYVWHVFDMGEIKQ